MAFKPMRTKQIADYFGVTTDVVRDWCKKGKFPPFDATGRELVAVNHSGTWFIYVKEVN